MRFYRSILLCFVMAWMISITPCRVLRAQNDSTPPALAGVQVKEWVIIIADPFRQRANSIFAAGSTLPDFIDTLRPKAAGKMSNEPSPIGVIRFSGHTDQKISVKLNARGNGTFYAGWPAPRFHTGEIFWTNLALASNPRNVISIDSNHWLAPLRNGSDGFVTTNDISERFLVYDVEFPFGFPLKLAATNPPAQSVTLANPGTTPLHDLVLYRPNQKGGWSSAAVDHLPSTIATTQPQDLPMVDLAPVVGDPSEFLLKDWKARLAPFGLGDADLALIVRTLKAHALDDRAMTAVFRLDPVDMNRLLPIEISPRPEKIDRVGLVIARNIDPALPQIIDQLILQLGNPDWHQREAATAALTQYGLAADSKLRSALTNKDSEIAARAEHLIAAINGK